MFGEHTGPINRVLVSPDHAFFITASDDGSVKVWDTTRLEKNLTPRSRQTHRHATGTKVKAITFVEHTHTFISAATDGSIHAVRIDYQNSSGPARYGKPQLVRQYQIPAAEGEDEYAVWMEHYRTEIHSILLMATNRSRLIGLDLKTMEIVYILENPVHHGTPTTFCLDRKRNWVVVGTTHGVIDLWDLRFCVRVKAWGLSGGTPIHRLLLHPLKGRGRWICAAGGSQSGSEITVWDIDKVQCREVYRVSTASASDNTTATNHRNTRFTADTTWKTYEPWWVDEEKPEGMLGRFATTTTPTRGEAALPGSGTTPLSSPSSTDRNGICALAVGLDVPQEGQDGGGSGSGSKCGFLISGGSDRKVRFWDVTHPDASMVVSGVAGSDASGGAETSVAARPRYDITSPTPYLIVTTEWSPATKPTAATTGGRKRDSSAGGGAAGSSSPRPSRSTVISLQQQQLLRSHLDTILDVAVLESPYGMTVSVDRAGMIYVLQ
jgi:phosphoinositide-3-kinase regulatory subunit 4